MLSSVRIVKFCAEECERQQSGELSVGNMFEAITFAYLASQGSSPYVGVNDVRTLGEFVEPEKNKNGYRNVPVTFPNGEVLKPTNIANRINRLCNYQSAMTPEEFYQEFQCIHPFVDGNGRVGAILYNWLWGYLTDPITPPEFQG